MKGMLSKKLSFSTGEVPLHLQGGARYMEMGKSASHPTSGSGAWTMGVLQHSGAQQDERHTAHRGEGAPIKGDQDRNGAGF
jgi:hypothetical protein